MNHLLKIGFFICSLHLEASEKLSIWTSITGSTLEGKGQSWNEKNVKIARGTDEKVIEIPFEKLALKDVIRAVNSLPFRPNDKALIRAITASTTSKALSRNTGKYLAHVNLYSYNGYNFSGSAAITPITEKYRISGRTVEVELRSLNGDGLAAIEFFALRGKGQKRTIYSAQSGVFKFRGIGSKRYFSAKAVEDFQGWVVVVRSPNTGQIIKTASSMQHLETFVVSKLPKTAKFKVNTKGLKEIIIKEAKRRQKKVKP